MTPQWKKVAQRESSRSSSAWPEVLPDASAFSCQQGHLARLTDPSPTCACREDIFKEIDILVGMNHENVIFLKEYFEEGNKVYLITELLTGGELLDAVLERGSYNEADARLSFVQLLRGIEYLHSK